MDQLSDLSPVLRPEDCLFKADICDAYYHLRLRKEDELYLSFCVGGVLYVPACLNSGLSVAPWFFTKAMRPVVAFLRSRGHRVFSYIDDFFGAGGTAQRPPSDRGRHHASGERHSCSVSEARARPASEEVRLLGCAFAGDLWDRGGHATRAVPPLPAEAEKSRGRGAAPASLRARSPEARPRTRSSKLRGAQKLDGSCSRECAPTF
jgi:hypothetical protein